MNGEQKNYQELQLKHARIQTGLLTAVLAIILVVGIIVCSVAGDISKQVKAIDLEKVNAAISSLEKVAGQLSAVDSATIEEAIGALSEAASTFSKADIGAINDGIRSLSEAADGLRELDVEKLNDLIFSLENVANNMEKTTSLFSKLFGK